MTKQNLTVLCGALALFGGCLATMEAAIALPGQPEPVVADWIRTNTALNPASGERLLIKKTDTPARRFQFQASFSQPGRILIPGDKNNVIRSESIQFFDLVDGVTRRRLEESLRRIYGAEIMRDFATAAIVYAYPTQDMMDRTKPDNSRQLLASLRGEIRQGEQFAYWIETVHTESGKANSGQVVVFEKQNIPKLEAELRNREMPPP